MWPSLGPRLGHVLPLSDLATAVPKNFTYYRESGFVDVVVPKYLVVTKKRETNVFDAIFKEP